MSGFTGDTTFSASGKPGRQATIMTLDQAQSMVPLVRLIVQDAVNAQHHLGHLQPEQDGLDRRRRSLTWPERQRRYQVQEDVARYEKALAEARTELDALAVALLDEESGRVGFPTLVNDRRAFFSWTLGQGQITHWHYPGDDAGRLIPPGWRQAEDKVLSRKRQR